MAKNNKQAANQDIEFRDGLQGAAEKDCDVHRDRSSIFDPEIVE